MSQMKPQSDSQSCFNEKTKVFQILLKNAFTLLFGC